MGKTAALHKVLCAVLVVAWGCSTSLAADREAWKQLKLSTTQIAGATVYYEKCFEPNLPFFEKEYRQILDASAKPNKILEKKEQIVNDINRILGYTGQFTKEQHAFLDRMFDGIGQIVGADHTFYLARGDTIKDFLRAGGKLPYCTYDKASDKAFCENSFGFTNDGPLGDFEFVIPITSDETFEEKVGLIFQGLGELTSKMKYGLAIHELTETTLFHYVKQDDVYWRWFTDGIADAVTYELLGRHFGQEDAAEWSDLRNISDYNDLEKEINLLYWMHIPYDVETMLEHESRLLCARYAYAMHEMQRLIKKYSLDCVRQILDKVTSRRGRRSDHLYQAIKGATGEDMRGRLRRYQTFESREEGIEKYDSLYKMAHEREDYEQMLINLIRRMELYPSPILLSSLKTRKHVSSILFKLGYEQAGDKTVLGVLERLKNDSLEPIYNYFSELCMDYALECDNPQKVDKIADEVLGKNPYSCAALSVRMRLLSGSGNIDEARTMAKKILVLVNDPNLLYHKAALDVLRLPGTNPNSVNK